MDNTRKPAPGTVLRQLRYSASIHEAEASNTNAEMERAKARDADEDGGAQTEKKRVPDVEKSQLYTKRLKQDVVMGVEDRTVHSRTRRQEVIRESSIPDLQERVAWKRWDGTRNETYCLTQIRTLQLMCHVFRREDMNPAFVGTFEHQANANRHKRHNVEQIGHFITKHLQMFQEMGSLPPGTLNWRVKHLENDDFNA